MLKKNKKAAEAPTALRVLAFGSALEGLAAGPLAGATIEPANLDDLARVRASACDLVLIDSDAWEAQPLAAALQALANTPKPPPVLLAGERLPTTVVRNLLRLERSDVLEAPFTPEQMTQAVAGLLEGPAAAPAGTARRPGLASANGTSVATKRTCEATPAVSGSTTATRMKAPTPTSRRNSTHRPMHMPAIAASACHGPATSHDAPHEVVSA